MANAKINRLNAIAGAASLSAIQPFIGVLAIKLGASNAELGTLSSLPNLVSIPAVLLAGWLLSRASNRKLGVAVTVALSRVLFLAVAAVPWAPPAMRVAALTLIWGLSMGPDTAARTGISALVADIFPGEHRARALAVRNSAATVAGVVGGLVAGYVLDALPDPTGFQLMFSVACVLGLVEAWLLLQLREPEQETRAPSPSPGLSAWMEPVRHRPYLRLSLALFFFQLSWQSVWPVFNRYQVTDLEASNMWISIFGVTNSLGMVLALPRWTRFAERRGNRHALLWASAGLALVPVLTAAAANFYGLALVNVFAGAVTAGVMLLMLNELLEVSPADQRPIFLAFNQVLVSCTGVLAPHIGGWALDHWPTRVVLTASTGFRLLGMVVSLWALNWVEKRLDAGERAVGGKLP